MPDECFFAERRNLMWRWNILGGARRLIKASMFVAILLISTSARAEPCVLGPADLNHHREFSLPRNDVCVIKRSSFNKLYSMKVTVPPKRGKFGSASISESAYRAGNIPGDDYFEYISTELTANGTKTDIRVRNVVHITP
jgi:hypothetical protein